MSKLYDIANDYASLSNSDMEPEMIADTLDGIAGEMEDKIEQCLAICKNETAFADSLREEAKKLIERAKALDNRVVSIKAYVAASMETAGKKSLRAGVHQVTVRAPSRSVEITNIDLIPTDYVEYETLIKPDKLAIKKQLEAGVSIDGATLKSGKPSLIIK